ncbi:MAG: S8 family peptidase [Thermoleophilaceae bacterium]
MRLTSPRIPALFLVLTTGLAVAASAQANSDAAPGELIVRFAPSADAGDRHEIREQAAVGLDTALPLPGLQLVEADPGQSTADAERFLERNGEVLYAEPNYYRRAFLRPNDPSFGSQWAFENVGQLGGLPGADINAVAAWDITTGSPSTVVAVVDTGVALDHPDLAGASWTNPGESGGGRESNRVDDDRDGLVDDARGWDWSGADPDPADLTGHGTHVAGTVGARTGNRLGVAGTSWSTRLMALRALAANGFGTVADIVRAYRYAAAKGARIVNASLGSPVFSRAEQDAIAAAPGVLFVVAAGNGGADGVGDNNDRVPTYPCAYPLANIVCVAATNSQDQFASFSNYGAATVDLAAPGQLILSTWPGGSYQYLNGTSMATPHVAGAAALLLAARPDLNTAGLRTSLLAGVDVLAPLVGRVASGGRLDLRRVLESAPPAIQAANPGAGGPAQSGALTPGSPRAGTAVARDREAPRLSLVVKRRMHLARVLRRGLPLRAICSEPCSVRVRVALRAVQIGTLTLAPTSSHRATLRLARRARDLLRGARRATVTVHARGADAAGNTAVARARVTLFRKRTG